MRVVETDATRDIQPVEDVVRQRRVEHVTILTVLAQVAVVRPVGVLHGDGAVTHRPVLFRNLVYGIVALIHFDIRPVIAAREEVGSRQRVVVGSLIDHVAVFLQYVTGSYVQSHLVVQKRGGVAESEVVAVIAVVGHDTVGIDGRG